MRKHLGIPSDTNLSDQIGLGMYRSKIFEDNSPWTRQHFVVKKNLLDLREWG